MKNYKDKVCKWGYITLCDKCVVALTTRDRRSIDISVELPEFPLMPQCEMCGKDEDESTREH